MPAIAKIRLSLGMVHIAMNMMWEMDRGRKSRLSHSAIEILYTAYFYRIRMADIAGMLEVSRSTATDHINYLEREGYVRRVRDKNDRRTFFILPTEKGEEWILNIEERLFGYLEDRFLGLTTEEQQEFARLCAKFSGVSDEKSFMSTLKDLKNSRNDLLVPMKCIREGRFLRLEEAVDKRYNSDGIK